MTYASPFLDPQLDAPAARPTVLNTNQPGRPSHDGRGSAINPNSVTQQSISVRSREEAGSQKSGLRLAAEFDACAFKVAAPHTFSSRSQRDSLTIVALTLIVLFCAFGIAVADKVLR